VASSGKQWQAGASSGKQWQWQAAVGGLAAAVISTLAVEMSATNPNDVLLVVMSVDLGGGESGDIHIYQLDDPHDLAVEFIRKRGLDGETLIPGEDGQVRLIDRLQQYIGECTPQPPTPGLPFHASAHD
jgi:hypothetical protein